MEAIPTLAEKDCHEGFQMPMGIANHSFYEAYAYALAHHAKESPYYAFTLTQDGHFLDSHKIGIDGPLFHFDLQQANQLHRWILSFERHAFVGH